LVKVARTSEEIRVERECAAEKLVYDREGGGEGEGERIRAVHEEASGCRERQSGVEVRTYARVRSCTPVLDFPRV
jgi:hypothetical protein